MPITVARHPAEAIDFFTPLLNQSRRALPDARGGGPGTWRPRRARLSTSTVPPWARGDGGDDRQAEAGARPGRGCGPRRPGRSARTPARACSAVSPGPRSTTSSATSSAPSRSARPDPHRHRRAGGRVGERVVDQVGDHLAQPVLVARHHDRSASASATQFQTASAGPGPRPGPTSTAASAATPDRSTGAGCERPLLVEPGQQQQVVDQQAHPGGLVLDAGQQRPTPRPGR